MVTRKGGPTKFQDDAGWNDRVEKALPSGRAVFLTSCIQPERGDPLAAHESQMRLNVTEDWCMLISFQPGVRTPS